jgi:beta-lactamase regulating signal transducer with metallopeptidase domain
MLGSASVWSWLVYSALVSLVVLTLGSGAMLLWRQPTRRLRIIELTLAGCLIAPWLSLIPGYPQVAVGGWRLPRLEPTEPVALPPDATPRSVSASLSQSSVETVETSPPSWDARGWLVAIYLCGVAVGIAWWLAGVAALARIVWSAHAAPPHCRRLLAEIAGERSDRVRLLVSRRAKQPFASVGLAVQLPPQRTAWRRAVIVLPEDLCDDEQGVRWALAHEWAHVERRDFRVWFVAGLARVLFYYQPLVWWLRCQLRLYQDFLADARASREALQPEDYAEFLTIRAAAGSPHLAAAGLGMGFRKSDLYRRVAMLVQNSPLERRTPRLWNALVSLAALVVIGVLPALSFTAESAAQDRRTPPQPKPFVGKKVAFVIGPHKFANGDNIAIEEVWSELGTLETGDNLIVKGTYTLASRSTATMLFSITHDRRKGPQPGCTIERPAWYGTVPFQFEMPVAVDGHLHFSFFDIQTHKCFATVYFGTYAQMQEIARWDVRKW